MPRWLRGCTGLGQPLHGTASDALHCAELWTVKLPRTSRDVELMSKLQARSHSSVMMVYLGSGLDVLKRAGVVEEAGRF